VSFFYRLMSWITAPFRWLFRLPMSMISAPRRLIGMSLPARVAWLTAIMLLICATMAFVSVLLTKDTADSWNYWWRWQTPVIVVLLIAIPPVVYFAVKSWLEGEVSPYPDIAEAWDAGMEALVEHGFDPTELPLFVVLGVSDDRLIKSIFAASGLELAVQHVPTGRAPLHWYAGEAGIFLVCRDASHLSRLTSLAGEVVTDSAVSTPNFQGTAQSFDPLRGTLDPGGGSAAGGFRAKDSALPGDFAGAPSIQGTLVPGAMNQMASPGGGRSAPAPTSGGLPRRDAEEQVDRLRYVCRLLSRVRQPLCPLNGILTVLPFRAVSDVMVAKDIPAAVQGDLAAVRQVARIRCPVTALVAGMEAERGFGELVRRVGVARARSNRFGKGYNVWNPPTAENIDAFSSHACGAFEDWVYSLFREPDGLSKPGNSKLYALLCKIRSELRGRLRQILLHGYSFDPDDPKSEQDGLLFSGCYFAATGDTEDRQAFARNVFEKMLDLEAELEWTEEALDEDDRYQAAARWMMALSSLLVIGLIGMVVYKWYA